MTSMGVFPAMCFIVILCASSICADDMFGTTFNLKRRSISVPFEKRTSETVQLFGGISRLAAYYITIEIGTPPQEINVLVDSGSADLLVFNSQCSGCSSGTRFIASESTTSNIVSCGYSGSTCRFCGTFESQNTCFMNNTYLGGDVVSGPIVNDQLTLGSLSGVAVNLGLITNAQSRSYLGVFSSNLGETNSERISGIWGLAYSSISFGTGDSTRATALDKIVSQKGIYDTFSMCLSQQNSSMSIGVSYTQNDKFQWTSIVEKRYYAVTVTSIGVNGSTIANSDQINNPTSIIDSGSTMISLPTSVFNSLYQSVKSTCDNGTSLIGLCDVSDASKDVFHQYCYRMTTEQLNQYPEVEIYFDGISTPFKIKPEIYLYPYGNATAINNDVRCLGFAQSDSGTILGEVFMSGFHIVFDRSNSKIGFGDVDTCYEPGETKSSTSSSVTTLSKAVLPPNSAPVSVYQNTSAASNTPKVFGFDLTIVGAIGACILVIIIFIVAISVFIVRRKRSQKDVHHSESHLERASSVIRKVDVSPAPVRCGRPAEEKMFVRSISFSSPSREFIEPAQTT